MAEALEALFPIVAFISGGTFGWWLVRSLRTEGGAR